MSEWVCVLPVSWSESVRFRFAAGWTRGPLSADIELFSHMAVDCCSFTLSVVACVWYPSMVVLQLMSHLSSADVVA